MAAAEAAGGVAATDQGRNLPLLVGRWQIEPDRPLTAFDRPSARAFVARDRSEPERALFALVCTTELPIRAEPARLLKGTEVPGLLGLQEFGPVDWPTRRSRRMALIYSRPLGESAAAAFAQDGTPGSETELARFFLHPLVRALAALAGIGVAHRGVRPDNLWLSGNDGTAVLGCGLSGPAGFDQPLAYEPIDRASASPAGRGEGRVADDLYALGVTLLALAGRRDPALGRSDEALLQARLEKGSYRALTEGMRVPLPLLDPLRGLLADDPQLRWSLRDVEAWLEGRRPVLRSGRTQLAPAVPFVLGKEEHITPRSLAGALMRQPVAAVRAVRSASLENWVRHDLNDPPLAKRLAAAKAAACGGSGPWRPNAHEELIAHVALLLDPFGPIRFRALAFAPDGFGPALAHAIVAGGDADAAAQAVMLRLPDVRESAPAHMPSEPQSTPTFGMLEMLLHSVHPGYGLERCLYEANPGLHCLSPPLRARCVIDLPDLLPALEEAAASANAAAGPLDRHLIAFIAARSESGIDKYLAPLADPDPALQAAGRVALLAFVRARHPGPAMPNLTAWIGRSLPPVVAAFRNRGTRVAVEREMRRAIAAGDLGALHAVVNDPERRRLDRQGFQAAKAAYAHAEAHIAALVGSEAQRRQAARAAGVRVAVMIAGMAASASAGVSLLLVTH